MNNKVNSKAKLAYFNLSIAILVLSIGLSFLFSFAFIETNFIKEDLANIVIYIIGKVLFSIALVVVTLINTFSKRDLGLKIVTLWLTLSVQIIPLITRILGIIVRLNPSTAGWLWVISLVVTAIGGIAYLGVILFAEVISARMNITKEEVKSEQIEVKKETASFDEDGNFKGPNK